MIIKRRLSEEEIDKLNKEEDEKAELHIKAMANMNDKEKTEYMRSILIDKETKLHDAMCDMYSLLEENLIDNENIAYEYYDDDKDKANSAIYEALDFLMDMVDFITGH